MISASSLKWRIRWGVMYAGHLVEHAPAAELFAAPLHPYTRGLTHSAPSRRSMRLNRLPTIPGSVPSLYSMPSGCPFHPRCSEAMPRCAEAMPPTFVQGAHATACWLGGTVFSRRLLTLFRPENHRFPSRHEFQTACPRACPGD